MLSALRAKREQLSINQRLLIWEPLFFLLLDPSSSVVPALAAVVPLEYKTRNGALGQCV